MTFPPELVKNKVARNSKEPCRKLCGRLISRCRFPDSYKDLLSQILGFSIGTKHLADRSDHPCLMSLHEESKRFRISLSHLGHPFNFWLGGLCWKHRGIYHSERKT